MSQIVLHWNKPHNAWLERKSVDTSGRLGSLYDASNDNIITGRTIQASETKPLTESPICRIIRGDPSHSIVNYLKLMDFDIAMEQSMIFGMITPSGVSSSIINYDQPINTNTRLLYYSYRSKEEELNLTFENANQVIPCPPSSTDATHMITKILWGFEVLCVISISNDQSSHIVDNLLRDISNRLKDNKSDVVFIDNEKHQLAQLMNVTVYGSETCIDNANVSLFTILSNLKYWQSHANFHHPLKYTMCSLRLPYNSKQFPELFELSDKTISDIAKNQPIIMQLNGWAKYFQRQYEVLRENSFSPKLDVPLKNIQEYLHIWLTTYHDFQKCLQKALRDIRRHRYESTLIQDCLSNPQYSLFKDAQIQGLSQRIQQFLTKTKLIKRLDEDQIQYVSVLDLRYDGKIPVILDHIEKALRRSPWKKDSCVFIFYSNDRLRHKDPTEWERIYRDFILKRERSTQNITMVYADFTNCQYDLTDCTIVTVTMQTSETLRNHPKDRPLSSACSPTFHRRSKTPPPHSITEINVLLLGETGVGKSTFINAFVNYLMFDTLRQAEQHEPIVLIPVSFITTIGDQFDEFVVKFGEVDPNENFEHQGQSVTQQCKSYVFDLNDKLRLRLIDTPGMGDTRGIDQDDRNIHHILTYINNLSHLNAICLLLKPNTSRLNVFFRSCINQLFTYLTPVGYSNIIFCFTNARSTFYAPGDTGRLLREMLKKEHQSDIPFEKNNTFCFDSESFRYLAARKRGVEFDEFQTQECMNSWTTSVRESIRLLNYILTRERYQLDEWQSPRKAVLDISMLARPLLETLRLIIFNWILCEINPNDNRIILHANPVDIEMCSSCALSYVKQVGPFFVLQYQYVSPKDNRVQHHKCSLDSKNFLIEYIVKYDFITEPQNNKEQSYRDKFDEILFKCDKLTHFLRQQKFLGQDDPFQPVLERFFEEEQQISQISNINPYMNRRVDKLLSSMEEKRRKNSIQLNESNEELRFNEICDIIADFKSLKSVEKQIHSILESRRKKMEAYEHLVETNVVKNKKFTQLT